MEEEKILLSVVPTGTIDLVHSAQGTVMQFNCRCEDALPICKGMCCGMRHVYNTNLTEEEANSGKYSVMYKDERPGEYFLAFDPNTKRCNHQESDGKCNVHEDKPHMCATWHCSPGGVGDAITLRGGGWFLLPVTTSQAGTLKPIPAKKV